MKVHNRPDNPGVLTAGRNKLQSLFHHRADISFHKGKAYAAGDENPAVYAVAPMSYAGGLFRQLRRKLRVPRGHKPPWVNKYLSAYLLGHGGAVLLNTAASGGSNTISKIQICCVLRRDPIAAPPEKAVLKGGIVQKRVRHVLGVKFLNIPAVLQGADEEKRPVAVVVGGKVLIADGISV